MLVLGRCEGETIHIGEAVLTVLEFRRTGGRPQVRVGISAPESIKILRGELVKVKETDDAEGKK